ncbi:40S ribosomal protein S29-like isoform X1 [Hibiscus syriacus]|uniref:40S ribosomal protein S29-like isoform X1 n=1 Tax=Hibiscus syriacus TaxID=106335 RepID=UPI0019216C3F|nr:40S ribosomal protein S29-like isoform X1 [Hibiscus syriacus]
MGHSNVWNSHPKTYGPGSRACRVCGNPHAIIRKYGLMCCRQCFRSNAKEIGFIKVALCFPLAVPLKDLRCKAGRNSFKYVPFWYGFQIRRNFKIMFLLSLFWDL